MALPLLTSRLARVQGNSMLPRLRQGTYVLVDVRAYADRRPVRGDVVLARSPKDEGRHYLKRVVGLPGETLAIQGGMVTVDGVDVDEPYALGWGLPAAGEGRSWRLADGEYFLVGDNRVDSVDSRVLGPFDEGAIVGRAWLAVWPQRAWGRVR